MWWSWGRGQFDCHAVDELLGNPTEDQRLLVMDYCVECKESAKKVLQQLEKSSSEELKDLKKVAGAVSH